MFIIKILLIYKFIINMKKLLVVLLILFISSCSSNIKENKETKISPIEQKIEYLKKKNETFLKLLNENSETFIVLKNKESINTNSKQIIWLFNKKITKLTVSENRLLSLSELKKEKINNLADPFWVYIKIESNSNYYYIEKESIELENKVSLSDICKKVQFCLKEDDKLIKQENDYYVYRFWLWYNLPNNSIFLSDVNLNENDLQSYSLLEFNKEEKCSNFWNCKWFLAKIETKKIWTEDSLKNITNIQDFWKLVSYEYNFFTKSDIEYNLKRIQNEVNQLKWKTEEETIKNIYDWILYKYSYDWKAANNAEKLGYISIKDQYSKDLTSFSWFDVLDKEEWVCQAFSYLFAISLHLAWINQDIRVVSGSATNAPNHAWNKVWNYYFDLTWDILRKEKGKKTLLYYKVLDSSFYNTHKIKEL